MKFKPCTGECTDDGQYCDGCGRSHEEIDLLLRPVDELVTLYRKMGYDNLDDYANAVAASIKYRLGGEH